MEKEFFGLDELQSVGLPAARTLRNRLDSRSGLIVLGGDVPPLVTMRIGGARVVARAALQRWLAEISEIATLGVVRSEHAITPQPKRRRGRPRKNAAAGEL